MRVIFKKGMTSFPILLALGGALTGSVLWINGLFAKVDDKVTTESKINIAQQKDLDTLTENLAEIKSDLKEIKKALYISEKPTNTYNEVNGFTSIK